jgi:hypothetical protein
MSGETIVMSGPKAVKFQVKIDRSALEKTHREDITMFSIANLALAKAALGRVRLEGLRQ